VLKDGKGDLSNSYILDRRKNYFCELLEVHEVSDVRQVELLTAEPLVSEPSYFKAEIAVEKLEGCLLPGIDQTQVELIHAGGETLKSEIHKFINSLRTRKNCLGSRRSLIVAI
jgi:hypothetical protein